MQFFRFFTEPDAHITLRVQNARIIRIVLAVCAVIAGVYIVLGLLQVRSFFEPYLVLALCLLGWKLVDRGIVRPVGFALPFGMLLLVTYRLSLGQGIRDTFMPAYLVIIMFASLILGRRVAVLFVALSISAVAWLIYLEVGGQLTPQLVGQTDYADLVSIAAFFIVTAALSSVIVGDLKNTLVRLQESEQALARINQELEKHVAERTLELERANKELEAFSYSVSHDLRAPLRSVNGYAKILQEDFSASLPPDAQGFLRKISESGAKMGRLIDELLAFSRVGRNQLKMQPVNMNQVVQAAIDGLAAETQARNINWQLADLPPAQADLVLIQQVYANLLGNAVKYSRQCDPAHIEAGFLLQDDKTIYFVSDNGAGFDMQYADKLFGVFQRLHRDDEFEGIGIGLAIVQRIIQRHGGRIWAHSQVGQGAAFYFTLG